MSIARMVREEWATGHRFHSEMRVPGHRGRKAERVKVYNVTREEIEEKQRRYARLVAEAQTESVRPTAWLFDQFRKHGGY